MFCSASINGLELLGGMVAYFMGYMLSSVIGGLLNAENFYLRQEQCGNSEYSQVERFRA
jgi:hypothetical protein